MEKLLIPIFLSVIIVSCNPSADPIAFGTDSCHFCKMGIVEKQFGAEAVTRKGRVYKYDALECMINDLCENEELNRENIHSLWAVNYNNPGDLINYDEAAILKSKAIPSPMGMNLSVYENRNLAEKQQKESEGKVYLADELIEEMHYNADCVW